MQDLKRELGEITEILLKPEDEYGELTAAIDRLYKLFQEVSGLDTEEPMNRQDVFLSDGKAIGPVWAGMCVKELVRTKRFIRGFYLGIQAALKSFSSRPVHILYAGTGPFATLAIPLTTIFSSKEVCFTMLEINPLSIQSLKKIIHTFDAERYVKDIIQCDAAQYKHKGNDSIHMVITETMQNALQKEPQVAITLNLVPQMEPEGILIPQNIKIEAGLMSPKKNMERMMESSTGGQDWVHMMDTIFELNKNTSLPSVNEDREVNEAKAFTSKEIKIPKELTEEYRQLCLFTTIQVFGEEELTHWQCSLNQPKKIMYFNESNQPMDRISFQYVLGEKPGFVYKIIT